MPRDKSGRTADATPHAASLIESLRDIGYSPETALADVIDNSITAKAGHVEILSETSIDKPRIAILDDGEGMSEPQLVDAMRPGTRNPLEVRDIQDLGRFGLGLKSASFSQCRRTHGTLPPGCCHFRRNLGSRRGRSIEPMAYRDARRRFGSSHGTIGCRTTVR